MTDIRQHIEQAAALTAHGLAALLHLGTDLGADPFQTLTSLRGTVGWHVGSPSWLKAEQQASAEWGMLIAWEPDRHAAYRLVANALEKLAWDYAPDLGDKCRALAQAIRVGVGDVVRSPPVRGVWSVREGQWCEPESARIIVEP